MLNLHFLNVENGDCIIIEYVDGTAREFGLIDCNRTSAKQSPARDKLIELGAERLQFVCITHPDKDHFSGILDVLNHYDGNIETLFTFPLASVLTDPKRLKKYLQQIKEIVDRTDDEDVADRHLEFMEIIQRGYTQFHSKGNWIEVTGDYDRIGISGFLGVEFYGIMPPKRMRGQVAQTVLNMGPVASLNNNEISAGILIKYAGRTVVLGGDAVDANWEWHRKYRKKINANIESDVVKLPHHGSRADNSAETLSDFFSGKPNSVAIISANGRSHPDIETLTLLDALPCSRLCTSLFNPNERALKRIYNNEALSKRLKHYLNVYTDPVVAQSQPCKGDICVSISPKGVVTTNTEFNTICGCTKRFSELGV